MSIKTEFPRRKKNRLQNFDYSSCETYFITICTKDKQNLFGTIVGAPIGRPNCHLSKYGNIVEEAIKNTEKIYTNICLEKYVIMPDHIHLLLTILPDGNGRPMGAPTIPTVINQLKGYVTKRIGFSVWQKLYYDHIIRDENDFCNKWQYIDDNPRVWCKEHGITKIDIYE